MFIVFNVSVIILVFCPHDEALIDCASIIFGIVRHYGGPARVNSDKRHGPKVATARKMKSRQETTSLDQIATVTEKPTISDKHL